jgi:hypothetical protein
MQAVLSAPPWCIATGSAPKAQRQPFEEIDDMKL